MSNNKQWRKKSSTPKQANYRNNKGQADALDRLVSKKGGLWAYKIYNNRSKPLVGNDGTSKVILYDAAYVENIITTIGSIKTKVTDVTRGNVNEGKNIVKYKTMSISNMNEELSKWDLFSLHPIGEGIFDLSNMDVFTYEEESGIYERDEVGAGVFKTGNVLSMISINTLDIFKEQNIYFEVFKTFDDIYFNLPEYKISHITIGLPSSVGLGKATARGISNNIEEELDLVIDETHTDPKLFLSKFSIIDSERFDMIEQFHNPLVQVPWKEAGKWVVQEPVNTNMGTTANQKALKNLLFGLACLKHFQDRRYQGVTRDAQGNITDAIRGFSLASADKIPDKEINTKFIEYWLNNMTTDTTKNLAYGYVAMLSKYISSSYTFQKGQEGYGQLYRFEMSFVYSDEMKTIDHFDDTLKLKLESDIINFEQVKDPNDKPLQEIKMKGLKNKFLNISKTNLSSDVFGIKIVSMEDQLKETNISQYIGENNSNEDNKYFAIQPAKDYTVMEKMWNGSKEVIWRKGDKEQRQVLQPWNPNQVLDFALTDFGRYRDRFLFQQINRLLVKWGGQPISLLSDTYYIIERLFKGIFENTWNIPLQKITDDLALAATIGEFQHDFVKDLFNEIKSIDEYFQIPSSSDYNVTNIISSEVYIVDSVDGSNWLINTEDEVIKFIQHLIPRLQAGYHAEKIFTWYFKRSYEVTYTKDVIGEKHHNVVSEQEYKDTQNNINVYHTWYIRLNFADKHKDVINRIKNFRLWTKGGGQFIYTKHFSYKDEKLNKIVSTSKSYRFSLSATHSFDAALTEIFDD